MLVPPLESESCLNGCGESETLADRMGFRNCRHFEGGVFETERSRVATKCTEVGMPPLKQEFGAPFFSRRVEGSQKR